MVEPSVRKSITAIDEPKRANVLIENELAMMPKSRTESDAPIRT